jgi:hypothetical protein
VAALDFVGDSRHRRRGRIDATENFSKRDVKVAQIGMQFLLAAAELLGIRRKQIAKVPHLVRDRAVLRDQQQYSQHDL